MIPELPPFLMNELTAEYGDALTQEILSGFSCRRPVTLRVNRIKAETDEIISALHSAGIACRTVPWYDDALILENSREEEVQKLPIYEEGKIYLQNLSSMLPPLILQPDAKSSILDMAAAPGGKTTQMAAMTGNQASITACERDKIRAERLSFNLNRQGVRRVQVMQIDARNLDNFFRFDQILLDAPCTGSGTIQLLEGEKPRRMDASWVKKTVSLQTALLQKALQLLPKGKELVYSTCSIMKLENEEVISRFVGSGQAELIPVDTELSQQLPVLPSSIPGVITVMPTALHEGFFAAKLRKK